MEPNRNQLLPEAEGQTLQMLALEGSLRWLIYFLNSVDKTKLSMKTSRDDSSLQLTEFSF